MKRISNEDGMNAGFRNVGRLALGLIPWALGIGALAWTAEWLWVHEIREGIRQEERAAIYTGAEDRPKSPIKIEVIPGCPKITHVDFEGTYLAVYVSNECGHSGDYMEYHWQELSPNGTVIHQKSTTMCPVPKFNGDKSECVFSGWDSPEVDSRVSTLRVWTER